MSTITISFIQDTNKFKGKDFFSYLILIFCIPINFRFIPINYCPPSSVFDIPTGVALGKGKKESIALFGLRRPCLGRRFFIHPAFNLPPCNSFPVLFYCYVTLHVF